MVADEKGIFRSVLRKNSKNNSAQVGQNFENQLPDSLSGIKNRLPTKLLGSLNPTSVQVGQKLSFGLPTNLVGGHFLFPTSCREVDFRNSVQLGQNYFFEFFRKMLLKMPFSSATTGRDFF